MAEVNDPDGLVEMTEKANRLERENAILSGQVTTLTEANRGLTEANGTLTVENTRLTNENIELAAGNKRLATEAQDLRTQVETLTNERDTALESGRKAAESVTRLEGELTAAEEKFDTTEVARAALEGQVDTLNKHLKPQGSAEAAALEETGGKSEEGTEEGGVKISKEEREGYDRWFRLSQSQDPADKAEASKQYRLNYVAIKKVLDSKAGPLKIVKRESRWSRYSDSAGLEGVPKEKIEAFKVWEAAMKENSEIKGLNQVEYQTQQAKLMGEYRSPENKAHFDKCLAAGQALNS